MTFLLRSFACVLIFTLCTVSCSDSPSTEVRLRRSATGDIYYGGLFRMNFTDDIRSIFPHNIVDASAFNIMNQVYEGLVKMDRDTKEIVPALAESFELSPDGKTYKFYIRKGVQFHEDQIFGDEKTRDLTPADVVYCLRKLCEPSSSNSLYAFMIDVVKGGKQHYEQYGKDSKPASGPLGIRVEGDHAVIIELEYPMANFLTLLTHPCCWIFPKELYSYGKEINNWSIGTGPFKSRTIKLNDVMILERNQRYWKSDKDGNQLPYLDAIRCNFLGSIKAQMSNFRQGHLDLIIQVPFGELAQIDGLKDGSATGEVPWKILSSPGLRVEYYGLQHRSEIYGDERVRQALNYAVDRAFIVDSLLMGYAIPAFNGFVPSSMPGYESDKINGFTFNPDTARLLLAEAGYPGGHGFPVVKIQINEGNETALAVAESAQKMLAKNLGLTVELSVLNRVRHYDQIEQGKVDFWRDGWIADYPDPENFLKLFHGKLVPEDSAKASYLNTVRFKDEVFDGHFEAALRETDKAKRMELFRKADQVSIDRAAVIPLYFEKWIWMTSSKVENLKVGGMGELDLTRVYFSNKAAAKPQS